MKFENKANEPIPLPKPDYLALHSAIAHILHETGLGEYLSTVIQCFIPNLSSMPLGKFSAEDFPLRIALMRIFGPVCVAST